MSYDLSDLGGVKADDTQSYDLSDLGGVKVDANKKSSHSFMDEIKDQRNKLNSVDPLGTAVDRFGAGVGQGTINSITGLANLIPGVNIPQVTSMSDNQGIAAKAGDVAGSLIPYGVTEKAISGLTKLPGVAKYLGEKAAGLLSHPATTAIGANALMGASQNPDNRLQGAAIGGTLGAVGHGLGAVMGTQNPLTKGLVGAALGAPVGYAVDGTRGAEVGAGVGGLAAVYPGAANRGVAKLLGKVNPDEIKETMQAGRDLGVIPRITEVTGSPQLSKLQGQVLSTPKGEEALYKSGMERLEDEKKATGDLLDQISPTNTNASADVREIAQDTQGMREGAIKDADQNKINNLLDSIHPDETDASSAVRDAANSIIDKKIAERTKITNPLYEAAGKEIVPGAIAEIEKDPNLSKRFSDTKYDPKNIYDLKDSPVNSIKTLETVRQDLSDEIDTAHARSDKKTARKLGQQLSVLDDIMENSSQKIKEARDTFRKESQPINALQQSAIGKIANMKDTGLKNVASTIFDRQQTNINDFNEIRNQLSQENPDLWKRLVRNAMQDRIEKSSSGDPGTLFNKNILGSKRDFQQFSESLKNMPDVQSQLGALKSDFSESSKKLKDLRKTTIAQLSNVSDSQLKNVSKIIFDPNQTDMKSFAELRDQISERSPDTWRQIMRNEIERRLSEKGEGVATHFYDKILKNENTFNQMMAAAKNLPDVQAKLVKMKMVFGKLINPTTPKIAMQEGKMDGNKGLYSGVKNAAAKMLSSLVDGRYDKGILDILTNKNWDSEFNRIVKVKDSQEKAERLGRLLGTVTNLGMNDNQG